MDDREKRDFQAGLSAEVDSFLKGEPTRRTFITRFGQMVGMLLCPRPAQFGEPGPGAGFAGTADPASLGQAQAAALAARPKAWATACLPRRRGRHSIPASP
jgi:multiple sugar transport system substrate-binding protein